MLGVMLAGKLYGREPVMVIPAKTPWNEVIKLMLSAQVTLWVLPVQHQARLHAEMVEVCTLQQDQGWRVDAWPPGRNTMSDKLCFWSLMGHTCSADITTAWEPWYFL